MDITSNKQADTGKRLMYTVLPVAEKQVTCERYSRLVFFVGTQTKFQGSQLQVSQLHLFMTHWTPAGQEAVRPQAQLVAIYASSS